MTAVLFGVSLPNSNHVWVVVKAWGTSKQLIYLCCSSKDKQGGNIPFWFFFQTEICPMLISFVVYETTTIFDK